MDYWRMFKAKGIRQPINYFFQSHLFDLINGTDTHTWLPKDRYLERSANFEHGVLYMCSWTSEMRHSFNMARKILGTSFPDYAFIDMGCGKGKAICIWKQECLRHSVSTRISGIDYYEPLIQKARQNYQKLFGEPGLFSHQDATELTFDEDKDKIIAYFYNPFDPPVLTKVVQNLSHCRSLAIYNNPLHPEVFTANGFRLLYERDGGHPNRRTMIFGSPSCFNDLLPR